MKTIIAGSRGIVNMNLLTEAIALSGFKITEVVSGMAQGADRLGLMWANKNGVKIKAYPAKWEDLNHPEAVIKTRDDGKAYNAAAGPIRNKEMAEYAEALILIWDGVSPGSADMLKKAKEKNLQIYEHVVKP